MRTWGRTYDANGNATWAEVVTDSNGNNDLVYVTTLIQNLKLNTGESPFYAQNGIPARQSVMGQIFPDIAVALIGQQFAPRFANLVIYKQPLPEPTYEVTVTTHAGVKLSLSIPIPT